MSGIRLAFAASVMLCSVVLSGCGAYHEAQDAVNGKLSNGLTVDQVTSASARLGLELGTAMQTFTPGCKSTASTYNCTQAIANTQTCAGGGSLATTGSATAAWSPNETGAGTVVATTAPTACSVPGTTLVLGSSGNLTVSGNLSVFQGVPASFTGIVTGTVTFGPTPSTACAMNLTVTAINSQQGIAGSCQVQGTVCNTVIGATCQ